MLRTADVQGSVFRDCVCASFRLEQDTELVDLRDTIEALQSKNHEAQAVIQGALNISDSTPKGEEDYCSSLIKKKEENSHLI